MVVSHITKEAEIFVRKKCSSGEISRYDEDSVF